MSECSVLSAETRSILEIVIRAAVDIFGPLKGENVTGDQRETTKTHFDGVVEALAREAARKINAIFIQLSAALHNENSSLKVRVGRLESELRAVAERSENTQRWRENVQNGCPVQFKQTGVIFTSKPAETFERKPDGETSGDMGMTAATEEICGNAADSGGKVVDSSYGAEMAGTASQSVVAPSPHTETQMFSGSQDMCTELKSMKKGKVFQCHVCNKCFNRQLHLSKHMNTHREPMSCEQCPRKFRSTATYERHLLRHEERKYANFDCSLCGKTFKSKMLLKTHQVVHNNTRPFICSTCGKAFKTKPCLQAHQVVHSLEKPHKCGECGESFRYAFALRCHRSVHTGEYPFKCGVCGKAFTKRRSLRTHEAVHSGKTFTCEVCGAGFTLQQNLKRHIRIHTGERPFKCEICGMSFVQDKLKAHMVLHGASKPFMCDLCGKTFLYNCQLLKHQKMAHDGPDTASPGERPVGRRRARACRNRRVIYCRDRTTVEVTAFSCGTCQKGFDSATSLKKHEQVHSGRLPYNCDTCGKSFLYKATFDYHQRTHSGERPFSCDLCGKTFIILHALKAHKLQHTGEKPHKCEQCGRAFRIYTNYRRHLRIHTGEKPYECEVCGVKFRQLGHVKFHMQVHTGEKPYACSSCGLGFSDSRLLKRHSCTEKY